MPRQISSRLSFFHKFILPGVFVLGIINTGIMYLNGWFASSAGLSAGMMLLIHFVFLAYVLFLFWPIKKIVIDDHNLYVSDWRTDITVPLTEIERVSEFIISEPRRVTIHLKNPSLFGRKLVFLATYRTFSFFSSHPIVSELRELARRQTLQSIR
jgi:hypothetical protein